MNHFESSQDKPHITPEEIEDYKKQYIETYSAYTKARDAMLDSIDKSKGISGVDIVSEGETQEYLKRLTNSAKVLEDAGVDVEELVDAEKISFADFSPEQVQSDIESAIKTLKQRLGNKFRDNYPLLNEKILGIIADKYGLHMSVIFDTSDNGKSEIEGRKIEKLMGVYTTELIDHVVQDTIGVA